jgi:hypothetical protein
VFAWSRKVGGLLRYRTHLLLYVPFAGSFCPEGRHYSCHVSGGSSVVLVNEAAEP